MVVNSLDTNPSIICNARYTFMGGGGGGGTGDFEGFCLEKRKWIRKRMRGGEGEN